MMMMRTKNKEASPSTKEMKKEKTKTIHDDNKGGREPFFKEGGP